MKILLANSFKWVDAHFDTNKGIVVCNEYPYGVKDSQIIAIKDDERRKYVYCTHCRTWVKNTKVAIKTHKEQANSSQSCLTCHYLSKANDSLQTTKYVLQPDGTYKVTTVNRCNLVCNYTWRSRPDINSSEARNQCRYSGCETAKLNKPTDFFSRYPNVFSKILTVDALNSEKWSLSHISDSCITYKHKSMNLYAFTTCNGFIQSFRYVYRSSAYEFRYSAKYQTIFWMDATDYTKIKPHRITDNVENKIQQIMSQLYKEEN